MAFELFWCLSGEPVRAVQHQLCQRETPGVFQQAHLLAGAAGVQQVKTQTHDQAWQAARCLEPARLFSSAVEQQPAHG